MTTFEMFLLFTVTIIPFIKRPLIKKIRKKYIPYFLLLLFLLHILIDNWRWQMIPAYALIFLLIYRVQRIRVVKVPKLTFSRAFGYISFLVILSVAWFLPLFLPIFSLPEPTGTYHVGSKWIDIKTNRDEVITTDPLDKRELMVKMWYPTDKISEEKREPYVDQANRLGFINKYSMGILPSFTINYLDRIKTNVYQEAAISNGAFPVLIFSPGYGSISTGYYAMLTEIASHGYIVANVSHTYESLGTSFPDGTMKFFDYEYQYQEEVSSIEHIMAIKNAFSDSISFDNGHKIIREASKDYFVTHIVERWSKDLISVIDQLKSMNTDAFFKDHIDLDRIGVFGHSRGGGAAGQTALKDDRIKVAANIDGIQWGEMMDATFQKPFLLLSSDWPEEHENINAHTYINKSTDYFYEGKLLTSGHSNFMDIPLMIPMRSLAGTGSIDPKLGLKITNEVLLAFFNKHLKSKTNNDPIKVSEQYSLLEMKIYKGDSIH
ncbi:alpha/beta hydrolase family protein [Aquimarina sp. SS2-1]|uniref:alpha/beta hydrolase family protein n=1 Tax=Aquimarina besae TaxID=3342247 RepID=UPI00366EA003